MVLLKGDAEDEQRLSARVIAAGNSEPAALRNLLRRRLPEYVMPTAFVQLNAFPLIPNALPRTCFEKNFRGIFR